MAENWVMVVIGALFVVFGFTMTAVSGAMPGGKPLYPPSIRFRAILIFFGILMLAVGITCLVKA
jgi:hypothetical protein